jgi:3-oxoacyl-(acyl-carrier-protein) synthase
VFDGIEVSRAKEGFTVKSASDIQVLGVIEVLHRKVSRVMSNNFAFGGINTSLIIAAPS